METFNSLYEIHRSKVNDRWDCSFTSFNSLYEIQKWKNWKNYSKKSFNSLYEITPAWVVVNVYCYPFNSLYEILQNINLPPPFNHTLFQFSLWDSSYSGEGLKNCNSSLSILFMRFLINRNLLLVKKKVFQFSLWDSWARIMKNGKS